MKRIAIITPCILPVPATKGGAVEELINKIIDDNESNGLMSIDLFTVVDGAYNRYSYRYTNIIAVNMSSIVKGIDQIIDKFYRRIPGCNSRRILDHCITCCYINRLKETGVSYDAVIIENMASTALSIIRAGQGKYDFPIFFHIHNDIDIYRSYHDIEILKRAGVQFIAVSNYIKGKVLNCNSDDRQVRVLYNGTNIPTKQNVIKKQSNEISFLFAGRIIREKGVKELIEAFNKIQSTGKYKLDIYGFSDRPTRYEKQMLKLAHNNSKISCHKRVDKKEIERLYGLYDIVVMPTMAEEPFGLVALEAMAGGAALITTDSGALPEVVGDGAVIVKKDGNVTEELSEAMKSIALSNRIRDELREKAFNRIINISDFDIKNYYLNFKDIIREEKITDQDLITVIVPVFNVSQFLRKCLKSIIDQSYRNIEIIIIDDGSTDGSGNICDELSVTDERVKVIHQLNMGLSGARNTGLDNASGKYIFFCDSDDYIEPDALEKMLFKLKRDHADIVACGFSKVYQNSGESKEKKELFTNPKPGRWNGYQSVIQMMRNNNVCTVVWNKLYRKELFEGIRFPLNVKNEDEATTYKLLYKAGIVTYTPDTLYNYTQRQESIIHENLEGWYADFIDAINDRIEYFRKLQEEELVQHCIISYLEWLKYAFRNTEDNETKKILIEKYNEKLNGENVPEIMGMKKKLALLIWKYFRY